MNILDIFGAGTSAWQGARRMYVGQPVTDEQCDQTGRIDVSNVQIIYKRTLTARQYTFVLTGILLFIFFFFTELSAEEVYPRRNAIVQAIEKVGPAVVNINTEEVIQEKNNPFYGSGDNPLDEFLKDMFPPHEYSRKSLGSGVIISPEGYILTNQHVILRATTIKVTLIDNREFEARLIGADARSDLAVIKIESESKLPYVEMDRSDNLLIGETIIAIGNPFGLSHTVTTGIISAINRSIQGDENRVYSDFIQLDASINPGNSGGPLLNINGKLIGINTAIYQKGKGIGFAIPINRAKRIVTDLMYYGEVPYAWIGLQVQKMTPNLASYFRFSGKGGVLVSKVFKKTPAEKAGLKQGDIIVQIGKQEINYKEGYHDTIREYGVGDSIPLEVFSQGEKKRIAVSADAISQEVAEEVARGWIGIEVTEITRKVMRRYGLFTSSGVLITTVDPNSEIAGIGVRPGDVLKQINRDEIKNLKEFKKFIMLSRRTTFVLLLVQRGKSVYYITLGL